MRVFTTDETGCRVESEFLVFPNGVKLGQTWIPLEKVSKVRHSKLRTEIVIPTKFAEFPLRISLSGDEHTKAFDELHRVCFSGESTYA